MRREGNEVLLERGTGEDSASRAPTNEEGASRQSFPQLPAPEQHHEQGGLRHDGGHHVEWVVGLCLLTVVSSGKKVSSQVGTLCDSDKQLATMNIARQGRATCDERAVRHGHRLTSCCATHRSDRQLRGERYPEGNALLAQHGRCLIHTLFSLSHTQRQ